MLGERPTLELTLGTNRGPEGPSIVQGSPAEGKRVKLIEVDPALRNQGRKEGLTDSASISPMRFTDASASSRAIFSVRGQRSTDL